MRAPVSVIIPTLNAADGLPSCLAALTEGREAGLIRELVISDGGSGDATRALAQAAGAHLVTGPASRGGQLRRGAAVARGAWLLFLHADSRLAPGWAEAVVRFTATADAGYFRLHFDAPGFAPLWVAGWANLRARLIGLPYGDQGLLIRRELYARAGGYDDIPLMEDVALARRLRGHLRPVGAGIVTSAARYRTEGWLRRGARNWGLLLRYRLGADPARLAARYRSAKERATARGS